jgi:hypothetical protein
MKRISIRDRGVNIGMYVDSRHCRNSKGMLQIQLLIDELISGAKRKDA